MRPFGKLVGRHNEPGEMQVNRDTGESEKTKGAALHVPM
jgi:hypothetical protein